MAKETYIFREPTNRSHPIAVSIYHTVFSSAWCSEWWCVALVCCNVLRFWNVPSTSWSGYSIFLISHAVIMRGQLKLQTCAPDWCWCPSKYDRLRDTATHCNIFANHCHALQHSLVLEIGVGAPQNCDTLPHTATHCNTANHCHTLQHSLVLEIGVGVPLNFDTLRHTATHYNSLRTTATHCNNHVCTRLVLVPL